jgi:aryl-alcohol dehydrogenase-like predicted oxidoreductase
VAYSPLGRGFLTGQIKRLEDLAPDDWRRGGPRFQGENFAKNVALVDRIREIAQERGWTPSQLALAWVLSRGEDVVPIFGTRRRTNLAENLAAEPIVIDDAVRRRIEEVSPRGAVAGERYSEAVMKQITADATPR